MRVPLDCPRKPAIDAVLRYGEFTAVSRCLCRAFPPDSGPWARPPVRWNPPAIRFPCLSPPIDNWHPNTWHGSCLIIGMEFTITVGLFLTLAHVGFAYWVRSLVAERATDRLRTDRAANGSLIRLSGWIH